ncbi:MAG TPA: hypothetical protein VFX28_06205, partial [Methylomirabilota bacterium]|nr:hypothetical protein [Methylomirabilota bacterium]
MRRPPTLDSLGVLFAAGLTSTQVRELCEAAVGLKLSRLNLHDWQLGPVRAWCEAHALALAVTPYAVQDNVVDENKGRWSNIGRRFTEDGFRFAYVAREARDTTAAL